MICLNQNFYILTDTANIRKKVSKAPCRKLLNINILTEDNLLIAFTERDSAEVHRLRSDRFTKLYAVNKVDSHDIVRLIECFDLELKLKI